MTGTRFSIEAYGCTLNHGEANHFSDLLRGSGHVRVPARGDPEAVVLFTCCVIERTERRMWRRMDEIAQEGRRMIVGGCLARLERERIEERYPRAIVIDSMGIDRIETCPLITASAGQGTLPSGGEWDDISNIARLDHIVPISTGCLGKCTYCISRNARGTLRSFPVEDIINRVRRGLMRGKKEILLTSQDSASYGTDDESCWDLGRLLNHIGSMEGDFRVRVGMMNPDSASIHLESILDGYGDPHVFKFFHIPLQSGSDRILAEMGRKYDVPTFMELISRVRSRFPDATISTDVIVGFPGETNDDFQATLEAVRELFPDILNITRFSPRPGTRAYSLENRVPGWVMKDRSRGLSALQESITRENLKKRLGRRIHCLVTEVGKPGTGTMMVRDMNYTPVIIQAKRSTLGSLIDAGCVLAGPSYLMAGEDWTPSERGTPNLEPSP